MEALKAAPEILFSAPFTANLDIEALDAFVCALDLLL